MTTDRETSHSLAFTGGTLTMGYVDGAFLKQLSSDYASNKDDGDYLYPLYDIRHITLAAQIDGSDLPEEQKHALYTRLVETAHTIEALLLAKKTVSGHTADLEAELTRTLDGIAGDIRPGLTTEAALAEYGLREDEVVSPYFIDSIMYDERTHAEKLYQAAREALLGKKGQTFFVGGGTDSMVMYSGKLTRRLIDEGIIGPENGNKVIFLSAMKSFGYLPEGKHETVESEKLRIYKSQGPLRGFTQQPPVSDNPHIVFHPQYIGRLFRKAMALSAPARDGEPSLPAGGYIISPNREECESISIHDARESMKVYYKDIDAFRSSSGYVGAMYNDEKLQLNPKYQPTYPVTNTPDASATPVEIAPPLISGNSTAAILNYLQQMPDTPVMILGGVPTLGTDSMDGELTMRDANAVETVYPSAPIIPIERAEEIDTATLDLIRERASRGVPTYYVNPQIYDVNRSCARPLMVEEAWRSSDAIVDAQKAGAIALSGDTMIGTYHTIGLTLGKLTDVTGEEKIRRAGGEIERPLAPGAAQVQIPMSEGDPIGLDYIPDSHAFTAGFNAAAHCARNVVINALPDCVTPTFIGDLVRRHTQNRVVASYDYTIAQRRDAYARQVMEEIYPISYHLDGAPSGPISSYAPAANFSDAGGKTEKSYTPSEIMAHMQTYAGQGIEDQVTRRQFGNFIRGNSGSSRSGGFRE